MSEGYIQTAPPSASNIGIVDVCLLIFINASPTNLPYTSKIMIVKFYENFWAIPKITIQATPQQVQLITGVLDLIDLTNAPRVPPIPLSWTLPQAPVRQASGISSSTAGWPSLPDISSFVENSDWEEPASGNNSAPELAFQEVHVIKFVMGGDNDDEGEPEAGQAEGGLQSDHDLLREALSSAPLPSNHHGIIKRARGQGEDTTTPVKQKVAEPVRSGKKPKMDRKCYYSRMYHRAALQARQQGLTPAAAKQHARQKAAAAALDMFG